MPNTHQSKATRRGRIIYCAECYRRGMGNSAIFEHIKAHYGIGNTTARKVMKDAIDWLCSYDDCEFVKEVKAKQIARAELLLENAIKEGKWEVGNKIIDTLNKMLGLYENKQKIEVTANEIQFKFGGTVDGYNTKEGEEQENI